MLAMALLLPGGHLSGLGAGAGGVDGPWGGGVDPSTVPGGSRWGPETGEPSHLAPLSRPASIP